MKKIDKKKIIIITVIAVSALLLVIGGTFAFFGWNSTSENKDATISVSVYSGGGECSKLGDNNVLLIPTSVKESGRIIQLKANHKVSSYGVITWNMIINKINTSTTTTSGLKHTSFKYELVNTTTGKVYGSGNFANVTEGSTITFTYNEKLKSNTDYIFALYLWIDGTLGTNPSDMQNQTLDIDISCSVTGVDAP